MPAWQSPRPLCVNVPLYSQPSMRGEQFVSHPPTMPPECALHSDTLMVSELWMPLTTAEPFRLPTTPFLSKLEVSVPLMLKFFTVPPFT